MRGPPLLMAEHVNDWDLQAVVRSCGTLAHPEPAPEAEGEAGAGAGAEAAPPRPRGEREEAKDRPPGRAALLYDLEYLDFDHKPSLLLPPVATTPPSSRAGDVDGRERDRDREVMMISFPAAAAAAASSTSGTQPRGVVPPGRKPCARTPRPKRSKKSQLKKVVREMPVADGAASSSSDPWAWRKYGQKPIKGSPYPRGYYKCSSMKGCMARKLVERSPAKPGVLIVTYLADHCHPVPTQLNALAGTTRHKSSSAAAADDNAASSPKSHEQGRPAAADEAVMRCEVDSGETAVAAHDDCEFWLAGMDLDDLLAPVDDDFDFEHVLEEGGDGVLVRRLSL